MNEKSRKVWNKLEENIGNCILFRDAAMKEVSGNESFTLQFATLSVPERVEAFLDNTEGISITQRESGKYTFVFDDTSVSIDCFDGKIGFENIYKKMFNRPLRCENLGINYKGQFNKNLDAYNDIVAKELHLDFSEVKYIDVFVSKIMRYVLLKGFTIGEDILDYARNNRIFENKSTLGRFLSILADNIRKSECTWDRVAETLKFIKDFFRDQDFIKYTKSFDNKLKDKKFIRNYLYALFITLNLNNKDLLKIIPKEPTLEFFDSIVMNMESYLSEYKVYIDIKKKYGEDFLELLMDVQETMAMCLGFEYKRVSEATFDMGELFFKDEHYWCSLDEMAELKREGIPTDESTVQEEEMDVSQGSFAGWTNDKFNKDMYSDEGIPEEDKVYIDDEAETEDFETGINMSALDTYEIESDDEEDGEDVIKEGDTKSPNQNSSIMNSQRGHESAVLNSGGV